MLLKIRYGNAAQTLPPTLSDTSTYKDLLEAISQVTQYPTSEIEVKNGFPPKVLSASPDILLKDLKVKHGDALIVSRVASTVASAAPTSPRVQESNSPASTTHTASIVGAESAAISMAQGEMILRVDASRRQFLSIQFCGYVLDKKQTSARQLRQVVCDYILQHPVEFSEVILGRPPQQYCQWILKDESWGGAIELSIFSKVFQLVISSVDVQTGRTDRFGEGAYSDEVFILYSGIHYDALALSPAEGAPEAFDQTRFDASEADLVRANVQQLASTLRAMGQYTDLENFTLRCGICQKGLKGEKDARAHAMTTGHVDFTEY
ncbi:hypothetical protein BZG36_01144 [Bifiguratus adelaidae]|uniref:Ubiquitin thioesterase OTU n=1 Tax=Bifiguratus adelaidae TaxID=1938954 RepID=A0A261Y618_9FUNG|nr:hypothetical protein BZG36_01144 [Bifiguratus adelaidae]